MAKNTYKSKKTEQSGFKLPSINIGFIQDRRLHLSFGFLLLVSSLFLLTAFISYLFTGQADQSLIGAVGEESIKNTGQEAENWLGLMGAIASHYFMFKYFGIASYLIPPLLFLVGFKIVFQKEILAISRSFIFASFFLIWISMFLGYVMFSSDQVTSWGVLGWRCWLRTGYIL